MAGPGRAPVDAAPVGAHIGVKGMRVADMGAIEGTSQTAQQAEAHAAAWLLTEARV